MPYVDVNVPVIDRITLPSGNTYYIADREIRDVVDTLSQAIAGGVSFVIAWDGTSAPVVANIPAGVVVTYEGTNYTGTLSTSSAQAGAFYLVKSATQTGGALDKYDEYVPVGAEGSKIWEKIGDTQIDLTNVVTGVSLTKQTDTVIGADATFTITQPTIALATDTTSGTGKVQMVTGISDVSASGDSVTAVTGLGTPSKDTFLKSVKVTSDPTISLTANTATGTGRITYVQSQGAAQTTKISASASGGAVSASGDSVTAITGFGTPTTDTVLGTGSTITVTPTTTYIKATASGANTQWNNKDSVTVLKDTTDVNVTKGS